MESKSAPMIAAAAAAAGGGGSSGQRAAGSGQQCEHRAIQSARASGRQSRRGHAAIGRVRHPHRGNCAN